MDGEDLIHYQWNEIKTFIDKQMKGNKLVGIALGGAAFSAKGSSNDLLWAIQWYIRTRFMVEFPDIPVGIINVSTWRSHILTKEEQREWKAEYPKNTKLALKLATVKKLPEDLQFRFSKYLDENRDRINAAKNKDWKPGSKSNEYLKGLFDLADSWGIAKHRASLIKKPVLKRRN
jgi:hypothetical protein